MMDCKATLVVYHNWARSSQFISSFKHTTLPRWLNQRLNTSTASDFSHTRHTYMHTTEHRVACLSRSPVSEHYCLVIGTQSVVKTEIRMSREAFVFQVISRHISCLTSYIYVSYILNGQLKKYTPISHQLTYISIIPLKSSVNNKYCFANYLLLNITKFSITTFIKIKYFYYISL